jgi:hypothetical protein
MINIIILFFTILKAERMTTEILNIIFFQNNIPCCFWSPCKKRKYLIKTTYSRKGNIQHKHPLKRLVDSHKFLCFHLNGKSRMKPIAYKFPFESLLTLSGIGISNVILIANSFQFLLNVLAPTFNRSGMVQHNLKDLPYSLVETF